MAGDLNNFDLINSATNDIILTVDHANTIDFTFTDKVLRIVGQSMTGYVSVSNINSTYVESYSRDATNAVTVTMKKAISSVTPSENVTSQNVTITFAQAERVSIDMTALSKWSTITSGTHSVTLIAKADGYADSLPSTPVTFTRVFKTLKGVYKFIDAPNIGSASSGSYLNFVSNGKSFKQMSYGYIDDMYQLQYANDTESITVKEDSTAWVSNNYKFVDLGSTAQEVDDDFYTWFTENTNVAYTVSTKLTNLSASAITPMIVGDTQTITLTASTNYNVPAQSAITVTGATITNYTKTSNTVCKITVGSVTGNITITASGVEQTTTISGKWKFKDGDEFITDDFSQAINFTSNGQNYTKLETSFMGAPVESQMLYGSTVVFGEDYGGTWTNEAYKTVDFGTTAQTVGKIFYNWFTANAIQLKDYSVRMMPAGGNATTITPSTFPRMTAVDTLEITIAITDTAVWALNDQSDIHIDGATLTNYTKLSDTSCKFTIGSVTGYVYIRDVLKLIISQNSVDNAQMEDAELSWNTREWDSHNAYEYSVYIDNNSYETVSGADNKLYSVQITDNGFWNGDQLYVYAVDQPQINAHAYNLIDIGNKIYKTSSKYLLVYCQNRDTESGGAKFVSKLTGTDNSEWLVYEITGDGAITVHSDD